MSNKLLVRRFTSNLFKNLARNSSAKHYVSDCLPDIKIEVMRSLQKNASP